MINERLGNRAGAANSLSNLGMVYQDLGRNDRALEVYLKSLAATDAIGDRVNSANTLGNLGFLYRVQGDDTVALGYYSRALELYEQLGHPPASHGFSTSALVSIHLAENTRRPSPCTGGRASSGSRPAIGPGWPTSRSRSGRFARRRVIWTAPWRSTSEASRCSTSSASGARCRTGSCGWPTCDSCGASIVRRSRPRRERQRCASRPGRTPGSGRRNWQPGVRGAACRTMARRGRRSSDRSRGSKRCVTVPPVSRRVASARSKTRPIRYREMVALLVEAGQPDAALTFAERAKGRVLLDVLRHGRADVNRVMTPAERAEERRLNAATAEAASDCSASEPGRATPERWPMQSVACGRRGRVASRSGPRSTRHTPN